MPVGNQRNLKYLSLNVIVSSVDFPSVLQKHGKLMITSLRPSDPFVSGKPANMVNETAQVSIGYHVKQWAKRLRTGLGYQFRLLYV